MRQLMSLVRRRFNHAHVIGEIYDNSAWNTSPAGIDLHGQYHEAFKNAIKDAIDAAALGNPDMARSRRRSTARAPSSRASAC